MVNSCKMHPSCLKVVNVDAVLGNAETELVSLAVVKAALNAAAGHPHGEAVRVVVPAEDLAL